MWEGGLPSFSHLHVDGAVGVAEGDFDTARIVEAAAVEAEVIFEGLEDELALVERGFRFARHIVGRFVRTGYNASCICWFGWFVQELKERLERVAEVGLIVK